MRLRRARRRQRHRRHGVGAEARRHGLPGARRREGAEHRRQDDPAEQGLPDARLRELHLDAEDGRDGAPPERDGASPTRRWRGSRRDGDGGFHATVRRRPRFVDESLCTGCRQCELACTVAVPDQFNGELVSRRAAYIPFPQAVPQKALVERAGTSPCTFACPAGIKAHGYVSLVRSGEYEKAFELVAETTPLVGSLGRACYAPCEEQCTRGSARGAARRSGASSDSSPTGTTPRRRARGRAAARAERQARRRRRLRPGRAHRRLAARAARLRRQDLRGRARARRRAAARDPVVPAAGRGGRAGRRERHRARRRDRDRLPRRGSRRAAKRRLRRGRSWRQARRGRPARRPGRGVGGVSARSTSCATSSSAKLPTVAGRTVAVVGGGNVAIDAARTARRLGAATVHMVCLEQRAAMPAYGWEVDEALAEGVQLHDGLGSRASAAPGRSPACG